MSVVSQHFVHLQCDACGARDSFSQEKEEQIESFERVHLACDELVQAMLKYLHIGPCIPTKGWGYDFGVVAKRRYDKECDALVLNKERNET